MLTLKISLAKEIINGKGTPTGAQMQLIGTCIFSVGVDPAKEGVEGGREEMVAP